jgi:hypothetical protein
MRRIIVVSLGLLLVMGCGSKRGSGGTLSGTVRYKGQPVNGAILRLHPASAEGIDYSIPVSQDGTFRSSDVPPGEYKVAVEAATPPAQARHMPSMKGDNSPQAKEMQEKLNQMQQGQDPPTIPFPHKYKNMATTDLKCTIKPGEQKLDLELKD